LRIVPRALSRVAIGVWPSAPSPTNAPALEARLLVSSWINGSSSDSRASTRAHLRHRGLENSNRCSAAIRSGARHDGAFDQIADRQMFP
jgi:hypothetical protein